MFVLTQGRWIAWGFEQENSEFAGYHDDCGPNANEKCQSAVRRVAFSNAKMAVIRSRDINAGLWFFVNGVSRGQNIYHLYADVVKFEPDVRVHLWPPTVNFDTPDYSYLHQKLIDIVVTRQNVCVVNIGNAQALPGNEQGVEWHFAAIGGCDVQAGKETLFLLANGDDVVQNGQSRWVTWAQIEAAHPVGFVEYETPKDGGNGMFAGWTPQGDGYLGPPSPEAGNPRYLVRGGVLDVLQKNPAMVAALGNIPVSDIYQDAGGTYHQYFLCGEVYWKSDTEFGFDWAGLALKQANVTVQALNDQVAQSLQDIARLTKQVMDLQQKQGSDPKVAAAEQLAAAVKILASE